MSQHFQHRPSGRPARFARYTSRTLYPGVRTAKKDQVKLKALEKYYITLIDEAAKIGSPRQKRAQQLIAELKARGKWPAKPDLKAEAEHTLTLARRRYATLRC